MCALTEVPSYVKAGFNLHSFRSQNRILAQWCRPTHPGLRVHSQTCVLTLDFGKLNFITVRPTDDPFARLRARAELLFPDGVLSP